MNQSENRLAGFWRRTTTHGPTGQTNFLVGLALWALSDVTPAAVGFFNEHAELILANQPGAPKELGTMFGSDFVVLTGLAECREAGVEALRQIPLSYRIVPASHLIAYYDQGQRHWVTTHLAPNIVPAPPFERFLGEAEFQTAKDSIKKGWLDSLFAKFKNKWGRG